jgi:hypothetical protein
LTVGWWIVTWLLLESVSVVNETTDAVLERKVTFPPPRMAFPSTVTVMVTVALLLRADGPRSPTVTVTVPLVPTAGTVPELEHSVGLGWLGETNVQLEKFVYRGRGSVTVTDPAVCGPAFVTWTL